MKVIAILSVVTLLASVGARAQRVSFYFNNRIGTEVNARFATCLPESSHIGSPDWSVLLLGGPVGTPPNQLQPLDPPSTGFRGAPGTPLAGYVVPTPVWIPHVPEGQIADVVVRLIGPSGFRQDFGPFTVFYIGGESPPNLQLGTQPFFVSVPECIPEPTSLGLALIGLWALTCWRSPSSWLESSHGQERVPNQPLHRTAAPHGHAVVQSQENAAILT